MFARPLVGVQSGDAKTKVDQHVKLPSVFLTPIRPDLVDQVFARMNKNRRQAHSVSKYAGAQTSAESWGTGRAVARIPRVPGGGTHRAGQAAFGNMCRGGRMFAPTKTWRRWHRKINVTEKRHALVSAISASAIPALVMARGHRIDQVAEIPLVVDNKVIDNVDKTSKAKTLLAALNANHDVEKVLNSRHIRAGQGKMRNRRYVQRRGPLVVFAQQGPLVKAFRNIPGIELVNVNHLNLLLLAPGGHLGRFVIWTKDAFERLDVLYGGYRRQSIKSGYRLPRPMMMQSDIGRIINSDEIQSVLRDKRKNRRHSVKRNPLKNMKALARLNPHAITTKRTAFLDAEKRSKKRAEALEAKRKGEKVQQTDAEKKAAAAKKVAHKSAHKSTKNYVTSLLSK